MKCGNHLVWRILAAAAVLTLILPRLALGEFGVCPPNAKTFGPGDPPEEVLAFIDSINNQVGGTLILEPGKYAGLGEVSIYGVVCIKSATAGDANVLLNGKLTVLSGPPLARSMLTLKGISGVAVTAQASTVLFAENSVLDPLRNSGSAFLHATDLGTENTSGNYGSLAMTGGSIRHYPTEFIDPDGEIGLENTGFAWLDGVQVTGTSSKESDGGIGIWNHDGGALSLTRSTVAANGVCLNLGPLLNECGGAGIAGDVAYLEVYQSIIADNAGDYDCLQSIDDFGYNVLGPSCVATSPTSIVADPFPGSLEGGDWRGPELSAGSPAIDLIPLELCTPTDGLGRARTDGDGDGEIACDAGALEYGHDIIEATIRARPYFWAKVGTIDLSIPHFVMTIYVFSTETFDATQIVFSSIAIAGFEQDAKGWPWTLDVGRDGLMDYQVTWLLSRMPPLSCGYHEHELSAITKGGREVSGLLKFNVVGDFCVP